MKNNLKYSCVIRTFLNVIFFILTVGTANAEMIVDFSAEVGVVQTGGIVTEWRDQSGNINHATTASPVGPVLTNAVVNGRSHPVLRFNGSNFLIAPPHVPATGTLFLVFSNTAPMWWSRVIGWADFCVGADGIEIETIPPIPGGVFPSGALLMDARNFNSAGDTYISPNVTVTEVDTVSWGNDGVTMERRLANGEVIVAPTNTTITSVSDGGFALHIGSSGSYPSCDSGQYLLQGDISALRVYDEQLGAAERATIASTFYSNWIGIGFVGTPNQANCHGKSVAALPPQFKGGLKAATTNLGFASLKELQNSISDYCHN